MELYEGQGQGPNASPGGGKFRFFEGKFSPKNFRSHKNVIRGSEVAGEGKTVAAVMAS